MANYWIKLYIEILDDPKMATLPDHLWRRVVELFLLAGRTNGGGTLPPASQIAWTLRLPEQEIEDDLARLIEIGIISVVEESNVVTNYAKRQEPASSTERWKRHNERKQNDEYNANVLQTKVQTNRLTEQKQNRIDTETDTEQNRIESDSEVGILIPLARAFTQATGLPEGTGGRRWVEGLDKLHALGATPEDLTAAVERMNEINYTIASPMSLVSTCAGIIAKRKGKGGKPIKTYKTDDPDYVMLEYADGTRERVKKNA